MSDNPKSYEVMLFDRYEMKTDDKGTSLIAYNLDGTPYRIGNARQEVWSAFKAAERLTPILLTFESFNKGKQTIKYVADAEVITCDDILKAGITATLYRLLSATDEEKARSQALSYAKDLACSGHYNLESTEAIIKFAVDFFAFIKGVDDVNR